MSETTTTTADAGTKPADATTATATQGDPADKPLGENGEKALRAERDRAKELEKQLTAATSRLTEIERANESAIDKAQREAQEAVQNAATATVTAFREAAVKFGGISAEDAELFLTGTDADTLTKQAARLVERASAGTQPGPRPDLSQGPKGDTVTGDPATDFANFLNGQRAG